MPVALTETTEGKVLEVHASGQLTVADFEPINQGIRCRLVIGGGDAAAVLLIPGRVIERQIRTAQADAVNLSQKPSLQRFASLVQRELDARRATIDRQDGLH